MAKTLPKLYLHQSIEKIGAAVLLKTLPHIKRHLARILPYLYKLWAKTDIADDTAGDILDAHRAAKTRTASATSSLAADQANRPVAELLDEALERQLQNIQTKETLEEIAASPNIKQLLKTPHKALFLERMAIIDLLLKEKLDDIATKNLIKIYDQKLLTKPTQGIDIFDDFLIATYNKFPNGNQPILTQLLNDAPTIDRLEKFLKPPHEYSPWKAGFETVDQWGNAARGRLIQVHEAHHGIFKNWKNLDTIQPNGTVQHSKALDFQHPTDLGRYAELKTTSSTNPTHLDQQLRNSFQELRSRGGHTLEFHVIYLVDNPAPNLQSLKALATELTINTNNNTINIIATPSKFTHWK